MSALADFLLAKEPLFDYALEQLERRTGKEGVDARLTAEIASKAARKTQDLGLQLDCSGQELYRALIGLISRQDYQLAHRLGGTEPNNVAQMLPLITKAIAGYEMPRSGFFLKEDVAEAMLLKHPPTAIMQRLGYDKVQTMLAHESLAEVYLALRFGQDPDWLNQFDAKYHSLKGKDFEERPIQLITYDPDKWGDLAAHFVQKKLHNIANNKEVGVIGVMPMSQTHMEGITLKVMSLIFHYYNELRLYSAFFKLVKAKKNFGEIVATTLIADPAHVNIVQGQKIHWRVIQRYFGKLPTEDHPEMFEPHVHPEDLHWRKAEACMADFDTQLEWWNDLDYVAAVKPGGPVTFNMMDVSFSYSNGVSYDNRYLYHFREALWNEVFASYMGQKVLREQLLVKLDNAVVAPESIEL